MRREENFDLSAMNTFRMKVKCALFIEYDSVPELEAIDFSTLPQPVIHIGEGSNLLFTGDFPGTVLHSNIKYIKYIDMGLDDIPVMVGAAVNFDSFVQQTCAYGLWGAENLSLIPGEMGAAAVQNIGAYGVEIKDIIQGVVCYDILERKKVKFSRAECQYAYRDSIFKNSGKRYVVTSVLLRLSRKQKPRLEYKGIKDALSGVEPQNPMEVRDAVIRIRQQKLPDPKEIGSAGSFFKNPVVSVLDFARVIDVAQREHGKDVIVPHFVLDGGMVKIPAAWLIDQCSMKGEVCGGAAVFEKQPLVIVNASGNALPEDVLKLEKRIISAVHAKFGITLSPEVEHIQCQNL